MKEIISNFIIPLFFTVLAFFSCDVQTKTKYNKEKKKCDNYNSLYLIVCWNQCEANPKMFAASSDANYSRETALSNCKGQCFIYNGEGSSNCRQKAKDTWVIF